MHLAVGAAIVGLVQGIFFADGVRVVGNVVVLQVARGRGVGQKCPQHGGTLARFGQARQKLGLVVGGEGGFAIGGRGHGLQLAVGGVKVAHGRYHRWVFAQGLNMIANGLDVGLNLVRLGGPQAGELAKGAIGEVGARTAVAQVGRHQDGNTADRQQNNDQF